jgi:hypothetical protein
MDKSDRLSSGRRSGSLRGQEDPSPVPPRRTASVPVSAVSRNAVISRRTIGGKPVNLPPSGAAWTRSAAATTADAFEVTPILVAPLRKSASQGIPDGNTATVKASIDAAVLANSDNDDSGDDEYSYFGERPNPDPKDHLPRDICGDFISLFVSSRKCQLTYSKVRKVDVFYEALTVEKKNILGHNPPNIVRDRFDIWRQDVKKRRKWTLNGIAESVFIITCQVHDLQEELQKRGGCRAASVDSKIQALVLMYSFFLTEINLNEANPQSQNKAVAAKNLQNQQKKSKSMKLLPPNFRYDANKV